MLRGGIGIGMSLQKLEKMKALYKSLQLLYKEREYLKSLINGH